MTDLGTLGGSTSIATAINDRAEVVGWSTTATGETHAFLWRQGRMTDLGTPGSTSNALAVDGHGRVVGAGPGPLFEGTGPVVWRSGVSSPLRLVPGANGGAAQGVADNGLIAGYATFPSGSSINRAVLWRRGAPADLGTLGGNNSQAFDVNDRGQVVGWSETADGTTDAFLWRAGTMTALPSLAGLGSQAQAINNRGQIVGYSTAADGFFHAVLWR